VLPAAGETVIIPANMAIILDMTPPPLGRLIVYGRLSFLDGDAYTLTAESIVVYVGPGARSPLVEGVCVCVCTRAAGTST
jgi:hypothetical protein